MWHIHALLSLFIINHTYKSFHEELHIIILTCLAISARKTFRTLTYIAHICMAALASIQTWETLTLTSHCRGVNKTKIRLKENEFTYVRLVQVMYINLFVDEKYLLCCIKFKENISHKMQMVYILHCWMSPEIAAELLANDDCYGLKIFNQTNIVYC